MAEQDCVLAIDISTQSSRAALVDFEGNILASAGQLYEMSSPAPGWAEQDARIWWETTVHNIRAVLKESGVPPARIAAVAADGQMHGTIPLGAGGEVLTQAVQLYCDKRSAGLVAEMGARPEIAAAYERVGNTPSPAWLGWKIKWIQRRQPEVYARTWKFLTVGAYITYRLTGAPTIDYAEASGTALMNLQTGQWDPYLFELLDLAAGKLPDIYSWTALAGGVTPAAAGETGLRPDTPVAVGGADMMTTLLAAGLTEPGRAVDTTGTAAMMCVYDRQPVLDPRLQNLRHGMPGWVAFGIIETGGGALKWFRDTCCQPEATQAQASGTSAYRLLDEQAARTPPGAEGLLFYPYLLGERTLGSPYSRGVFFGLTPRTGRGAMARAVMEGIVFDMRRTLEIAEDHGVQVAEIRSVGGGARSQLWNQIRADIYQKPVAVVKASEGGILGAAMLAGVAAGVFPDLPAAADRLVQVDRVIEPNPAVAELYNEQYHIFTDLHDRMLDPFERLARLSA